MGKPRTNRFDDVTGQMRAVRQHDVVDAQGCKWRILVDVTDFPRTEPVLLEKRLIGVTPEGQRLMAAAVLWREAEKRAGRWFSIAEADPDVWGDQA